MTLKNIPSVRNFLDDILIIVKGVDEVFTTLQQATLEKLRNLVLKLNKKNVYLPHSWLTFRNTRLTPKADINQLSILKTSLNQRNQQQTNTCNCFLGKQLTTLISYNIVYHWRDRCEIYSKNDNSTCTQASMHIQNMQ